jgi:hypothetical protein
MRCSDGCGGRVAAAWLVYRTDPQRPGQAAPCSPVGAGGPKAIIAERRPEGPHLDRDRLPVREAARHKQLRPHRS